MQGAKGFTLIELLIVVAIIGIVAAIAIPSLLRARIAANESATIGDIRTVISAQAAYHSANSGWYDSNLRCLNNPTAGCIPNYPATAPHFLDSNLAQGGINKSGYRRSFEPAAPPPADPDISPTSAGSYVYHATPTIVSQTGVRGFAGDSSGILCSTPGGTPVGVTPGVVIDTMTCTILR